MILDSKSIKLDVEKIRNRKLMSGFHVLLLAYTISTSLCSYLSGHKLGNRTRGQGTRNFSWHWFLGDFLSFGFPLPASYIRSQILRSCGDGILWSAGRDPKEEISQEGCQRLTPWIPGTKSIQNFMNIEIKHKILYWDFVGPGIRLQIFYLLIG